MKDETNGELVPLGGGDNIPLLRSVMSLGRRESCDICLPFPDVSGIHCELSFRDGYWSVRDLNSTNGVKVNGNRVQARPLKPGDEISFGRKHRYMIQYALTAEAQHELDALLTEDENIFGKSLLEKAGLASSTPPPPLRRPPRAQPRRWGGPPAIDPTTLDD